MLSKMTCILLLFTLFAANSRAQEITGNLQGRILDSQGVPVAAVNITVSGKNLQGVRGAASDDNGYFRVLALPAGAYTVKVEHVSYQPISFRNVAIRLGKTASLGDVHLQTRAEETSAVVVIAERPYIDPASTDMGANLTASQYEALPIDRNYRDIATLIPQANKSYYGDETNIAGATGLENSYYIDGMHVTDPYKAVTGINLPYNFVREVQVKTGGYEAEYGRCMGGAINVITYSGGNEFHGNVFGFNVNNRLASESNRGVGEFLTGDFSRYDAGLSLGGPVLRDKLWFFLAYNRDSENEDIAFTGSGVYADRKVSHLFAGKLTWQATNIHNFVITLLGDPNERDKIAHNFPGLYNPSGYENHDPFLGNWKEGGIGLSLQGKHILGRNLLLESSLSRYNTRQIAEPGTQVGRDQPLLADLTTGIWSGGYGNTFDRRLYRTAAGLTGTYFIGKHDIKAGVEYEENLLDEDWRWVSKEANGAGIIMKYAEDFYFAGNLDHQTKVRSKIPTLFVQSSVLILPGLRLNPGIRWEKQFCRGPADTLEGNLGNQFQPRIGIIYQFGKDGAQKLSGFYGRFYQQSPISSIGVFYSGLTHDFFGYDHNPVEDPTGGSLVLHMIYPLPENLKAEYFDEFALGYERGISSQFKVGVRGVYRELRKAIQDVLESETGLSPLVNPGSGKYDNFPKPVRRYTGLELTVQKYTSGKFNFLASYVLSRNYGNYTGLYNSDLGQDHPNGGLAWTSPQQVENGTGRLPNDRTHIFKFLGSYRFDFGLVAGTSFIWQSGAPLNEFGSSPFDPMDFIFLQKRGTAGQTPSIWDLNLRLTYRLDRLARSIFNTRLILDVLHVFSQRKPVYLDQQHYLAVNSNGNQASPNPNYLKAIRYQPPMAVRLGMEIGF